MIRKLMFPAFAAVLITAGSALAQSPHLQVVVDISEQSMRVYQGEKLLHTWPVSTARKGKKTPTGSYSPQWLSKNHRSSLYNNAPMPYSIFYSGNYAIHGTNQTSKLGSPASAGCVRLSTENAARLFNHVQTHGKGSMSIQIRP